MTRTITVNHLARIEGHGGINVVLDGARVERVEFNIFEGIRLFEGLVRGRTLDEISPIVSRVCSICSQNHAITALRALEDGLGQFDGTVLAVTHDRWFARGFDRFLVFGEDGSVYESPEPVWDEGRVQRVR